MTQNNDSDEVLFGDNGKSEDNKNSDGKGFDWDRPPLFHNNDLGISVWPGKDKNGNFYLRVSLPLVKNFNVFVNNGAFNGLDSDFNKLVEHYKGEV